MKTLAKITAIVLIVFGVLLMLAASGVGLGFALRAGAVPMMRSGRLVGLLAGMLFFGQGLFLAACGEALYLLAQIVEQKERPLPPAAGGE